MWFIICRYWAIWVNYVPDIIGHYLDPQSRNMRNVDRWIEKVHDRVMDFVKKEEILVNFERSDSCPLHTSTYQDGSIWVEAYVRDAQQEARFKAFLESLKPPRPMRWRVEIVPILSELKEMEAEKNDRPTSSSLVRKAEK